MDFTVETAVFLTALLPVSELRVAIPVGLSGGVTPVRTYLIAVGGNILPVIPLLLFLKPVAAYLRRFAVWDRFFGWLYSRTEKRAEIVQKYEAVGLALFVAVPLPVTGAWTGCVAASCFGLKFRYALPAICCGVAVAGAVVTLLYMAGEGVIKLF